jgi:DNA topoisomerase I
MGERHGRTKRRESPRRATASAGLRYLLDDTPGIRRVRMEPGFHYQYENGRPVKNQGVLRRIKSLAVPPAWTGVWISPDPQGHLQATGRDARGRKQYRYHPRWRETRDENKFSRMVAFAEALPAIRRRLRKNMRERGLGREKVIAAVVRLMEMTGARIGNQEYAAANRSYGLTTLRDRHARFGKDRLRLRYRGKSGKEQRVDLDHPRLARIVKRCRDLPGMQLFQYVDEKGQTHNVTSSDVNRYLAEASGGNFTAKDFRTWTGTVVAAMVLGGLERGETVASTKRMIQGAIEQVARQLGNTPTVCRKCYVHPAVLEAFSEGTLARVVRRCESRKPSRFRAGLRAEERAVLRMMRRASMTSEADRLQQALKKSIATLRPRGQGKRPLLQDAS